MISSISSSKSRPLTVPQARSDRHALRCFFLKLLGFILLFLAADRILGWLLLNGLDRYYGLDEPAAVLCIGHSHTVLGIDKVALSDVLGVPVAKFAVEGANATDRLEMIKYYFRRQPQSVRVVVYDVDAHSFTEGGLSSSSYRLLFPFMDDPGIAAYVRKQCTPRSDYWIRKVLCLPRYNELTVSLSARGYLKRWTNLKWGVLEAGKFQDQVRQGRFRRIQFNQETLRIFDETIRAVQGQKTELAFTYIPTVDILNRAQPDRFETAMNHFRNYGTNSFVRFLDYNRELESRHELFFDPIHLNPAGQKVVTKRLAHDLKLLLRLPTK